jgi:predicted Zn finger-like uncharacterized protein
MLIRCARCHAVFSVQEGLTGPVQRAFRVECGRCEAVFDAQPAQVPEAPRIPPPRRTPTPVPVQRPVPPAPPAAPPLAVERHASPDAMAEMGALRPVVYGPVVRKNPLTRRGAMAIAVAAAVGAVALLVLGAPRAWRGHVKANRAMEALLLDDDASLAESAALFAEAARGDPAYEGDRATALLLRASAQQDLGERLEPSSRADADVAAKRETLLREAARLVQEGSAAAHAAVQRRPDEVAALRAMALAAALTSGNPARWLGEAQRRAPGDALVACAAAVAELGSGHGAEARDRAIAALARAQKAEPRLLRAQVDAAALALDRRDLAFARSALQRVVEANPRHERAKALLSLASR